MSGKSYFTSSTSSTFTSSQFTFTFPSKTPGVFIRLPNYTSMIIEISDDEDEAYDSEDEVLFDIE